MDTNSWLKILKPCNFKVKAWIVEQFILFADTDMRTWLLPSPKRESNVLV